MLPGLLIYTECEFYTVCTGNGRLTALTVMSGAHLTMRQ